MKPWKYSLLAGLMVVLCACSSLGLAPARNLGDRITYAYAQNSAIRTAAASQINAGLLTADDGRSILSLTDNSRTFLDAANIALTSGDLTTAEGRLLLSLNVMEQLQKYLNERAEK